MRTRKFPMLDADPQDFEDIFGPRDNVSVGVLGHSDRLIGEGIVELPVDCLDPFVVLTQGLDADPEILLLVEEARTEDLLTSRTYADRPRRKSDRVVSWSAPRALLHDRRRAREVEELRYLYSR